MKSLDELTELEKVWLACALDTEGHISLFKTHPRGKPYLTARIGIANTNLNFLQRICWLAGGNIRYKDEAKFICLQWQLYGQKRVLEFLECVFPYLIIKRERAKVVIDFCRYRLRYSGRGRFRLYDDKDWGYNDRMKAVIEAENIARKIRGESQWLRKSPTSGLSRQKSVKG